MTITLQDARGKAQARAKNRLAEFRLAFVLRRVPRLSAGQVQHLAQHPEAMRDLVDACGGEARLVEAMLGKKASAAR